MTLDDCDGWREYDAAAEWCAAHAGKWRDGDPLPDGVSARVRAEIDADPDAFAERVRGAAYARAMDVKGGAEDAANE